MRINDLRALRDLMQEKCIRKGDFTLASGLPAKYYYDAKPVTLRPSAAKFIGSAILKLAREVNAEGVGGMAIGADPIAQSVALASLDDGGPEIPAFLVRAAAKDHGTREQTSAAYTSDGEPLLRPGRRVVIVDDVITTGGSVVGAINAAKERGAEIAAVIVLVERHEGGGAKLGGEGYNFVRLFYTNGDGDLFIDESVQQRIEGLSGAGILHR